MRHGELVGGSETTPTKKNRQRENPVGEGLCPSRFFLQKWAGDNPATEENKTGGNPAFLG